MASLKTSDCTMSTRMTTALPCAEKVAKTLDARGCQAGERRLLWERPVLRHRVRDPDPLKEGDRRGNAQCVARDPTGVPQGECWGAEPDPAFEPRFVSV